MYRSVDRYAINTHFLNEELSQLRNDVWKVKCFLDPQLDKTLWQLNLFHLVTALIKGSVTIGINNKADLNNAYRSLFYIQETTARIS